MGRDFDEITAQMEEMLHRDPDYDFCVEPGQGMTYRNDMPTLYGYSIYEDSSVLAGQMKRVYIHQFETEEQATEFVQFAREAGYRVDVAEVSGYRDPDLSHLPDDGDY